MKYVRWSVQDTLIFTAAVPISCLVGRSILVLAPTMAVAAGLTAWNQSIHDYVLEYFAFGSRAYIFAMAFFADAPTILLCSLILALLGATNSRFGVLTGALIPLFVAGWSYYCLRDVLMNSPLVIAAAPEYACLYAGRRVTVGVEPDSQPILLYRIATYLLVAILAVSSEVWWQRYWNL